jgi:hypothetical protein
MNLERLVLNCDRRGGPAVWLVFVNHSTAMGDQDQRGPLEYALRLIDRVVREQLPPREACIYEMYKGEFNPDDPYLSISTTYPATVRATYKHMAKEQLITTGTYEELRAILPDYARML